MNTTIFVPKTINVGYQNRSGTYTGKLAYVVYTDNKGKLRKEVSWNSWRDKDIEPTVFDNVPTSGFVLNKKVGDYVSDWNHRQAYCRVYDPRDFEFEITIENLLYILENANSIKGKGLEGEFIYGWNGKDLILIPVESPDYKQIAEYSEIIHNNKTIKAKDLIVGAIYMTKDNSQWVYVGRFNLFDFGYEWEENNEIKRCKYYGNLPHECIKYRTIYNYDCGKHYWFAKENADGYSFVQYKSISQNKFISCVDEKCTSKYSDIYEFMTNSHHFSPHDQSKDVLCELSYNEFDALGLTNYGYTSFKFLSDYDGTLKTYLARSRRYGAQEDLYDILEYSPTKRDKNYWDYRVGFNKMVFEAINLNLAYKALKPKYIQRYLENGKEFERSYTNENK